MNDQNLGDILQVTAIVPPARKTTGGNGTGVDLQEYVGDYTVILSSSAGGGTSPTLDVKLQDSPDNNTFTDIDGAVFTQVDGTAALTEKKVISADSVARYIRAVLTITGTSPTFDMALVGVGVKQVR